MLYFYKLGRFLLLIGIYFWNSILYIFYPPYCAACRNYIITRTILCKICKAHIKPITSGMLYVGTRYRIPVFAISQYENPLRQLILAKHRSDIAASYHLAELMWEMTYIKEQKIDYLIPIPLHWSRYAWRGFNQSYEIARILSQKSSAPIASIVKRQKKTSYQARLSIKQRVSNIHKAFVLSTKNQDQFRGKHLVIVDDLITTGSTAQAVARELVQLKPALISIIVACRVV